MILFEELPSLRFDGLLSHRLLAERAYVIIFKPSLDTFGVEKVSVITGKRGDLVGFPVLKQADRALVVAFLARV